MSSVRNCLVRLRTEFKQPEYRGFSRNRPSADRISALATAKPDPPVAKKAELEASFLTAHARCAEAAAAEADLDFPRALRQAEAALPLVRESIAYPRRYHKVEAPNLPAVDLILRFAPPAFARRSLDAVDCIISSTLSWHSGFVARIDEDHDDDDRLAIYNQPLSLKLFGRQCDLEWIYVVGLRSKSLDVYGGGYESPEEIVPRGLIDPMTYADQLIPEAQAETRTAIATHMSKLMDLGWNLNGSADPARPIKKRSRRTKAVAA
jgi:hypothetical protein